MIDIDEPDAPGPGQALVRTHCMGVCGTDVSSYLGKFPFFEYPRIPGHDALRYVANIGTLVYVGVTSNEIVFPHPALHRPEITFKASRNALPDDFAQIIRLIEDGVIDIGPWITHRVGFERLCQEMDNLTQPGANVLKAIIELN